MGFTRRDVEAAEDAHSSQPSRLLLSLAQLALSSAEGLWMNEKEDLLVLIDHIMAASWELLRHKDVVHLINPSPQEVWPIAAYAIHLLMNTAHQTYVLKRWDDLATSLFPSSAQLAAAELARLANAVDFLIVFVDSLAEPTGSSNQPALAKLSTGAVACIAFAADLLQIKLTSRTVFCIQRIFQAPADIEARLRLLGEIFAGVIGFIQADAFVDFTQQHGNAHASGRAAYQFLRQWRGGTEKDDLWDACIVAVLKALLEEGSGPHRPSSAQPRSPVYDLLAQAESAAWMHRIVIALAEPKGRQGLRGGFGLLAELYKGDLASLLAGCTALLKPESNCGMDVRGEALATMEAAVQANLERQGGEGRQGSPLLWPREAVQLLLYTLQCDPSLRIRRAAMSLAQTVTVKSGSAAELHILEAVLLKCRDKDASVREMAFAMAKQFDPVHLARVTDWHMWRMILDVGLIGLEGIVAAGQVLQSGRDVSAEIDVPQTHDDAAELLRQLMRVAMRQQSQPQSVIDILDQMELQHAPDFVLTAYLTALRDVVAL